MLLIRSAPATVLLFASLAGVARADPPAPPAKSQCFDAYEQGQRLRKESKLRAAHDALVTCSSAACPDFVKQDCAKWLGEVDASTPTIVIVARDPQGHALEAVRVTMDGQPLTEIADGRAISVDPGPHDVHYEALGQSLDDHVVVAEGARDQQLVADFGKRSAPPPRPAPAEESRPIPLATWVLGGVAVAGGVSFATFAILGRSVQSCAPTCTSSQVSALRRDYLIADISWIAGLAAAGGALYFFLRRPAATPPTTASWAVSVQPALGGARLAAEASF
jgi:hypothetical protein